MTLPSALPDDKAVLFFDGVCVLCSGFMQFVLRHDKEGLFRYATAQSELGQAVYRGYGLDGLNLTTNILVWRGKAHFKSGAFIKALRLLGVPWSLAVVLNVVPTALRDRLYDPIARNRYRWFGERPSCYLPRPEESERFLS